VPTTPKAMKEVFGRMPRSRMALEKGMHSPWVSRALSEMGFIDSQRRRCGSLNQGCGLVRSIRLLQHTLCGPAQRVGQRSVERCGDKNLINSVAEALFRKQFSDGLPESAASMGGLTVLLPGKESLSASHIVFDEVTGLAAMMKLFYRETDDKPRNHSLLAPMLALSQPDRGLGFPATTTLIPQIFLRNAGPDSTLVSLKVDWRNETKSGEFVLQPLTLASGAVTVVNVEDPQRSGQIPGDASWATVKLAYVGKKADLIPVAISYDKELRYGLQTPFSEAMSRMWAGGMWHVDSTHNTFIATGNGGSGPTTAEATLFYNGGKDKYRIEKKLAPGEQLWLDVGKVLRDQVVDSEGRTLPPDTMTGSYELRDLDHPYVGQLYEGKLVIDKTYGHAAYGCASCCQYSVPYFLVNPFAGPPDDDFGETLESTDSCGGLVANVTDGGYDWASSNTAIATLSSPTLHTVAPGSATGSVAIQLQHGRVLPNGECPAPVFGPTQPLAVGPYQVEPIDTASQGPAQCPSGSAGWVRNVTNQLQYQNGSAYAVDGLTVSDTLSIGSTNELGLHGQQTGQATTTGDGSFPDTYSVCSTDCPSSGYSNVLQQWTAYGVPLPHVNGVVYKCQSITIDGN